MEDALGEMDGGSTFRICISLFTTICPSPAPDRSDGPRSDRQADRSCSLYTDVLRRHNLATFVHYGTMLCMHLHMCTHLRTPIDLARSTLSSLPFFSKKKTIDKVTIIDKES